MSQHIDEFGIRHSLTPKIGYGILKKMSSYLRFLPLRRERYTLKPSSYVGKIVAQTPLLANEIKTKIQSKIETNKTKQIYQKRLDSCAISTEFEYN